MTACSSVLFALAMVSQASDRVASPAPVRPREEAIKMVEAYIVSNLQDSLGLTDAQFVKLLPLVKKLQTDRRAYIEKRVRALGELRRALQSGTATEAAVLDRLKEAKTVETEEPERIRKDMETIDATLTPLQQAKYRVLELEVERKMRELMGQLRSQMRGMPDRPRPE